MLGPVPVLPCRLYIGAKSLINNSRPIEVLVYILNDDLEVKMVGKKEFQECG